MTLRIGRSRRPSSRAVHGSTNAAEGRKPEAADTSASLRVGRSRRPASRDTSASLRVGIDLGGTKTEGIVMDVNGQILLRERRLTPQAAGYDAILNNIQSLVLDLERRAGAVAPLRVGIGTPGAISTRTGNLKNSNTVCLNGRPLKQDLERLLARELRIANDANCFALSEAIDGAGAGHGVVFGVILGTGVGGGIVVNGRLIDGAQNIAGEWGHNVLEADGPPCYCGKRGCVETFLSGPGLARDYQERGGQIAHDARAIVEHAAAGDPPAAAAMQRYLERFGRALSVVVNILDPDAIVLGGGLSNIARLYTEGRESLARQVFDAQGRANAGRSQHPASRDTRPSLDIAGAGCAGAANDELRTLLLPHVHGDSSGVRGAAQLWPAAAG